jgi:hypothetical protein
MAEPIPPASTVAPMLGTAFDALLGKALAAEPAERPGLNAFSSGLVAALGAGQPEALPAPGLPAASGPAVGADEPGAAAAAPDPLAETARIAVPAAATRAAPIPTPPSPSPSRAARSAASRDRRTPSTATILLAAAVVAAALLLSLGNRLLALCLHPDLPCRRRRARRLPRQ